MLSRFSVESRHSEATSDMRELTAASAGEEQVCVISIQRLERISILMTAFGSEKNGTVYL